MRQSDPEEVLPNTLLVPYADEQVVRCPVCGDEQVVSLASFGVHEHEKRQAYLGRVARLHLYAVHGQGYNPFSEQPYRRRS